MRNIRISFFEGQYMFNQKFDMIVDQVDFIFLRKLVFAELTAEIEQRIGENLNTVSHWVSFEELVDGLWVETKELFLQRIKI